MCHVTKFCFCCSLRCGAVIAAILTLFDIFLNLAIVVVCFKITEFTKEDTLTTGDIGLFRVLGGIHAFCAIIGGLVFCSMLFALTKHQHGCLLPWVIYDMIEIVYLGLNFLSCLLRGIGSYLALGGLAYIVVKLYMWIIVISFGTEVRLEAQRQMAKAQETPDTINTIC